MAKRGMWGWLGLRFLSVLAGRYSDVGACARGGNGFKNQESLNVISRRVTLSCLALCLAGKEKGSAIIMLSFCFNGSGGRDRTYDQLINSQLLYR